MAISWVCWADLAIERWCTVRLVLGGDLAAVEFQLQAAVEIDPQMRLSGFTRRVRRVWHGIALILIEESPKQIINSAIHLGNPSSDRKSRP